jgi:hypothetical protein
MIDRVLGLAALVPFAVGALAPGAALPPSSVDFSWRDPAVVESSGLVVRDGLFVTVNDSGDSGRVLTADSSGRTVGVTSWPGDPVDDESLAPAGDGEVWVGDTGDNTRSRSAVVVRRVPFGRGDRTTTPPAYSLVYPDGAHDAETLLADPRTGRLYVVTKDVFGGTMYAAPAHLSVRRPNRLRPVADGLGYATDGSFLPDGRAFLLRDYTSVTAWSWPGLRRIGSWPLPAQRQGEGLAVAEDGTVHLSSEGQFSPVLSVHLPLGAWAWLSSRAWAVDTVLRGFVGRVPRLLEGHGAPASDLP